MTAHRPAPSFSPPVSFPYQPALDGLRGVALATVLLFHGGFGWMQGGYVGVSVFFTLSGYLITSLLLRERADTGSALRGFYTRRAKRLLPASLLCLTAVSIASSQGRFETATGLPRQIVMAALHLANWDALTRQVSYAALIQTAASPLDHFWSLAIEEQFYWVWPLVFLGLLSRFRGPETRRRVVGFVTVVLVLSAPLIARQWGADVAYWATPARIGEMFTGVWLAMVLHARPVASWVRHLGWLCLVAILAAAVALPSDHGLAYQGWFGVGSFVTVGLIAALQLPGTIRRVLSWGPLVAVGRISYGAYLYHWPIFLLVFPLEPRDGAVGVFVVRLLVTFGVSLLSFHFIESPIRHSHLRGWPALTGFASVTLVVVALANTIVASPRSDYAAPVEMQRAVAIPRVDDVEPLRVVSTMPPSTTASSDASSGSSSNGLTFDTAPSATADVVVPAEPPALSRPVRITVVGDSTAAALSAGLVMWASKHPELAFVTSVALPGCGLVRDAVLEGDNGRFGTPCATALDEQFPVILEESKPDLVVALVTLPDITARQWSVDEGLLQALDARYVERRAEDYRSFVRSVLSRGQGSVLWLTPAPPSSWSLSRVNQSFPDQLWIGLRDAIAGTVAEGVADGTAAVAGTDPAQRGDARQAGGRVHVLDFAEWLRVRESADDRSWRSDGLHLDAGAAERVATEYLGPALISLAVSGELPAEP